jgi:transketolase
VSSASYSLAIICALTQLGRLDGKATDHYRQDGGSLELWPAPYTPGFETHTGRSAHGLAYAAGIALGRKLRGENGRVWVLLDAQELESGEAWEALNLLKSKPLTNLVIMINDPRVDETTSPMVNGWFEACAPWEIQKVNGHEPMEVYASTQVYQHEGPLIIHARTHPCQGMIYLSLSGLPLDYVRFKSSRERMNFEGAVRAELYNPKRGS